ncbi:MAG: MFS transporter [Pseudomonadota bacterium]
MSSTIWQARDFRAYLASTAASGMALAMQQLLLSWVLIDLLALPARQVGFIQALVGVPGVFLMLMGGVSADRSDPRDMLIRIYLIAPIFPLFLFVMDRSGWFAVWSVMVWGFGMSITQAYSLPAQQAILNRISGDEVQRAVTAATAAGFVVQIAGLTIAGQMDRFGVAPVLLAQGLVLGLAALATMGISSAPTAAPAARQSALQGIVEGLRATYRDRLVYNVLVINFVSSIFNAGSFITVFPFIVKRVYDGDALMLSLYMVIFYVGATISNTILLRFMPLLRPGKLFLLMQLSRIAVIALVFIAEDIWVLTLGVFGWGLNMGVTSNLARSIVQESAQPEFRGRMLSVFSVGMIGSVPLGAVVLGLIVEYFGPLNALLPAMVVSVGLCAYGILATQVWRYESAAGARN